MLDKNWLKVVFAANIIFALTLIILSLIQITVLKDSDSNVAVYLLISMFAIDLVMLVSYYVNGLLHKN